MNAALALIFSLATPGADAEIVTIDRDDVQISRTCRVRLPAGTKIEDRNDDGIIHITASDIVVTFDEGQLCGSPAGAMPDAYKGVGVRISGQRNVAIRGLRASGFRVAVWATDADGLVIEDCDVSDCRRDRLLSTPQAEDERDWLWPHANDRNEWLTRYGAGIYVEDSKGVTVRGCRARHGQNGLCLDRVDDSKVYDNDFSFLSGWGIALWRSNNNFISRNACDFCVRGYSHGVYNRGQDSAGILMFEQCNRNVFVENSATHGGDGFFGFAGKEALGEAPAPTSDFDYRRRGCNENVFAKNDFSFAAAHGLELTFSFSNRIHGNLFENNAICGIWGGYSQNTVIADNDFVLNGDAGYGAERGGVNIEHGRDNLIIDNRFVQNACGVHLWWDEDAATAKLPWARANGIESTGNLVTGNTFDRNALALHLRGRGDATLGDNVMQANTLDRDTDADVVVHELGGVLPRPERPRTELGLPPGRSPVGARRPLRGREHIVMTEWGPWDHESPLVRLLRSTGDAVEFELRRVPKDAMVLANGKPVARVDAPVETVAIKAPGPGVHPYSLVVEGPGLSVRHAGVLVAAEWDVVVFNSPVDPREDPAAWREAAQRDGAVRFKARSLAFNYGYKGPGDILPPAMGRGIGRDRFGMIATTTLKLDQGTWRMTTLSDDGVRVAVDGNPVIENWTHHGPMRDAGTTTLNEPRDVALTVEHFELDGYAVLEFTIEPAR